MLSSVDGRTDSDAVSAVTQEGEYEATSSQFQYDAWACGRATMQEILGDDEPFVSATNMPAGPRPVFVARKAETYAVSLDTSGKLRWTGPDVRGDQLICVVSERAPAAYVDGLREKGISHIVTGAEGIDLIDAAEKLGEHFGIRTLLLEGGGHISRAFLRAGLIGRGEYPAGARHRRAQQRRFGVRRRRCLAKHRGRAQPEVCRTARGRHTVAALRGGAELIYHPSHVLRRQRPPPFRLGTHGEASRSPAPPLVPAGLGSPRAGGARSRSASTAWCSCPGSPRA